MASYIELARWCVKHGVAINGVAGADVEIGGRGVVALRNLEAGHVILQVPERLLLSVASARRDQRVGALLDKSSLNSMQILSLHLLHEASKGAGSFWHVYIQSLPRNYTTFCSFRREEIEALQLREASSAAEAAVAETRANWEGARPVLRALELPLNYRTLAAWIWATATISSRTMYVPSDPVGALMPFGDLHNYEPPPPPITPDMLAGSAAPEQLPYATSISGDGFLDEPSKTYKIVARREYAEGEQVFLCYGAHTNLDLLELYGFLLPRNAHDRAYLPPQLFGPQLPFKPVPAAACYLHADGRPSWELLYHLRLNAASAAERKAKGHLLAAGQRVSAKDDVRCLIWLVEACQQHLASLPSSLEQDEALLGQLQQLQQGQRHGASSEVPGQGAGGSVREQMLLAVQWCICHKRIVCSAIQVAQSWFAELRKKL